MNHLPWIMFFPRSLSPCPCWLVSAVIRARSPGAFPFKSRWSQLLWDHQTAEDEAAAPWTHDQHRHRMLWPHTCRCGSILNQLLSSITYLFYNIANIIADYRIIDCWCTPSLTAERSVISQELIYVSLKSQQHYTNINYNIYIFIIVIFYWFIGRDIQAIVVTVPMLWWMWCSPYWHFWKVSFDMHDWPSKNAHVKLIGFS